MVPRAFFLILLALAVGLLLGSGPCLGSSDLWPWKWAGEPFQVGVWGMAGASAFGLLRPRRGALAVACSLAVAVAVAGMLTLSRWEGGDDGGGVCWFLFVMPPAVLAAVLGIGFAVYVFAIVGPSADNSPRRTRELG